MASNKNQHFVPRCYLKAFTENRNKKTINLFNVDREKIFKSAAIKHQCSSNYFYGNDEVLENAIQSIERAYASALRAICKFNTPLSEINRSIILRFWLLQYTRTEAASRRAVEMSADTDILIDHPEESVKLEIKQAVQIALLAFAENLDALDDLKVVLIKNKTSTPFVTSDDPAVLVNRWYINNKYILGSGNGVQSSGMICVLPISPSVCCVAYDGDVYSIPNKSNWVETKRLSDINALNDLQYLNCFANLYFGNNDKSEKILEINKRNYGQRPESRHRLHYAIADEESNGSTRFVVIEKEDAPKHTKALIHMETIPIKPPKWPTLIHWRRKGYVYTNKTGVGHIRKAHILKRSGPPFEKFKTGH